MEKGTYVLLVCVNLIHVDLVCVNLVYSDLAYVGLASLAPHMHHILYPLHLACIEWSNINLAYVCVI